MDKRMSPNLLTLLRLFQSLACVVLSLLSNDPISSPFSQEHQWDQSFCLRAHYTVED